MTSTTAQEESVPVLKLQSRRKLLGYMVPLLNLPFFLIKAYDVYSSISSGAPWNTPEFLNDIILLVMTLGINLLIPRFAPVYTSNYTMTEGGLKISRFMKGKVTIPYPEIERMELYIRDEKRGPPSTEALQYAKDTINGMRKTGFRFIDYSNAEKHIALVFTGDKVYMISPAYPKVFANKLKKKVGWLPIRFVILTPRGKRIQDQTP